MAQAELILFDWNGTLWDDAKQWLVAAKASYPHAGLSEHQLTDENIRTHFDVPIRDFVFKLGAPQDLPQDAHQKIIDTFLDTISAPEHAHLAYIRDNALSCVQQIHSLGIEQRIVSNHPTEKLHKELEQAGLSAYFNTVCGNENPLLVYHKATKAERVVAHLNALNAAPERTLIIADTREEMRIAKEFGLISVAITGGYNTREVLEQENPTYIIDDLHEVLDLL